MGGGGGEFCGLFVFLLLSETKSQSVACAGLRFMILLPPSPQWWDFKRVC